MSNKLISIVCIISLIFNIFITKQYNSIKEEYDSLYSWSSYLLALRLDKQAWICDSYAHYLTQVYNGQAPLDELLGYSFAVRDFSVPDLVNGAPIPDKFDNMYKRIVSIGLLGNTKEHLLKMNSKDLLQLKNSYSVLATLLNRSNKEASLAYFVFINDFDSTQSIAMQQQTLDVIKNIEQLLGKE